MVGRTYPLLTLAFGLLAAMSSFNCRVLVEDNCANQSEPGNTFCRDLYGNAAPFCSPCRRANNGCVQTPPFSCRGYYDEIDEDAPEPSDESSDSSTPPEGGSSSDGDPPMTDSGSGGSSGGSTGGSGATDSGGSTGG